MEQPASTRPKSPRSRSTSTVTPSPGPSHTVASPELLQTIQSLQTEIAELRAHTTQGMTADEKAELSQMKADLVDARKELDLSKYNTLEQSGSSKRIVNYGTFCTVEDVD